jgi:phage terminase small subunit|tara:strand:+ start:236 stop:679 length:444 start_codon:yes stop_codon:yes gene_type:complete
MVNEDTPLTDRQERFVVEYLATANGAEAARRAGYSEHTAKEIASENLTKPNVKRAITAKRDQLMTDTEDKVQWLIDRLTAEATADDNNDSTRVRALEVLAKIHGAFAAEKTEITTYSGTFLADLDLEETEFDVQPIENSQENNELPH